MSTHLSNDPKTPSTAANTENVTVYIPQQVSDNQSCYPVAKAQYEEVAQNEDIFWESLQGFHSSFGTKFMVPTIGGKALDLHRLFVEVTSRGGLEKVIRDRKWKEVIVIFNFPSTITSASFVLRKYYLSLLYHFEQVYYFRKQVPPISVTDPISRSPVNGLATVNDLEEASSRLQLGCSVTGTIDGKFDNGYLVTVNLGSDILKGVLYHIPHVRHMSQSSNNSAPIPPQNRKRSRLASRDPSHPKPNRSSYNFFFAENYATLRPLYYGQEKAISKKIGHLWSELTEAEKQVLWTQLSYSFLCVGFVIRTSYTHFRLTESSELNL
ncbi:hypothetical protein L1049_001572 [Liquidambar formosana]|uniref:ARID domain-containing protein n=1 Tax=Liquidambar formosana TaxID=63359 RepID=A0AAP0NEY7_LIQFO